MPGVISNQVRNITVAGSLALGWFFLTAPPSAHAAPRPNIVYFLADDLGREDCGFMGGKEIRTPNLDRLAREGAVLDAFYVQPVCSPTRAAFLTGRYPMRYGLQVGVVRPFSQYGLPLQERTLAKALREAGYQTAVVGKWHLGHAERAYLPTERGFDFQYGHYNGMLDYFTHQRDGGFDWHRNDVVSRDQGYTTHLITEEAERFLRERDSGKPFFLYVPYNAVHTPLQVPEKYEEPYRHLPNRRRAYAAMTAALDESVGHILATLDGLGLRTNTLVIFSSDNGGAHPGRLSDNGDYRAGKGTLYEGGVRVGALAAWTGRIPAGAVINEPIHIVDWYPTLLKLAGASLDQTLPIDGRDIWPALAEGRRSPEREILLNAEPTRGALRLGDWKLVINGNALSSERSLAAYREKTEAEREAFQKNAKTELFHLGRDPYERNNLADDEPAILKRLMDRYRELAAQAVAPKNHLPPPGFQAPAVWGKAGAN